MKKCLGLDIAALTHQLQFILLTNKGVNRKKIISPHK